MANANVSQSAKLLGVSVQKAVQYGGGNKKTRNARLVQFSQALKMTMVRNNYVLPTSARMGHHEHGVSKHVSDHSTDNARTCRDAAGSDW